MKQIKLTQNQVTFVDDEDYEYLNQWKWWAQKSAHTFYAIRAECLSNGKQKRILMHRMIMNPPENMDVDHRNHNGLDNQRKNLRVCTRQQNMMNQQLQKNTSSMFKGVIWETQLKLWRAQIKYNGKYIYLGFFEDEIDGAIAYNQKAKELFGQFAYFNSIPDKYKNRIPVKYKAKTSSRFAGVSWNKSVKKWVVRITHNKKEIYLGCFRDEIDGAITYNQKATELFGRFAFLNPIPDEYKNRIPVKYKAKTSSRFVGVYWNKATKKWCARIYKNKKQHYLGLFDSEEQAHQAILKAKQEKRIKDHLGLFAD